MHGYVRGFAADDPAGPAGQKGTDSEAAGTQHQAFHGETGVVDDDRVSVSSAREETDDFQPNWQADQKAGECAFVYNL